MSAPESRRLKQQLAAAGFDVFRTHEDRVDLAERVRDDLLMESGVSARCGTSMAVRFRVQVNRSDFPEEADQALFERARSLAEPGPARGYLEVGSEVVPLADPVDASSTVDTSYVVVFEKSVSDTDQLQDELRFALGLRRDSTA